MSVAVRRGRGRPAPNEVRGYAWLEARRRSRLRAERRRRWTRRAALALLITLYLGALGLFIARGLPRPESGLAGKTIWRAVAK